MTLYPHTFAVLAYGDSPHLRECLHSLLAQTVKSTVILVTSTPSDRLYEMARAHGIPLFEAPSGRGIAHDWNFALDRVDTKYATLAHQDDVYLPRYTEYCLQALSQHPNALIGHTDYTELFNGKERDGTLLLKTKRLIHRFFMPFRNHLASRFTKQRYLSFGSSICTPSVFFHLDNLTGFYFSDRFSINMDWDAWKQLAMQDGCFVYVPHKLMQHRIHPDSETSKGLLDKRRHGEDLQMFQSFWPTPVAWLLARLYSLSYRSNER
ncbi:MAG: glycosyltransferase family 2 protein [Saprospiraceae bacterium]